MIRIAIVEDEERFVTQLHTYLTQYAKEHELEISVEIFRDGAEIIEEFQPIYDVIFLDVAMPKCNGMQAAKKIREKDSKVVLVFVTSMAQYAIHGYEVGALDFILKPLSYETFEMKFARAIRRMDTQMEQPVLLHLSDRVKRLSVRQIYYVEIINRMLHYHTDEGEYTVRGTLQEAARMLEPHHFAKCNHWYLVNLRHVTEVQKESVTVAGHQLAISRRNKTAFLTALTEFVGGAYR
jgi:DNA-binding LytR/AlgR family response regulator